MPNLIDAISITDSFYRISYIKDAQTLTGRIDCSEVCDGRFINKNAFCLIHRVTPSVAWHPLSCTLNLGFAMGNLPSVSRRLFCIRHKCWQIHVFRKPISSQLISKSNHSLFLRKTSEILKSMVQEGPVTSGNVLWIQSLWFAMWVSFQTRRRINFIIVY